MNDDHHPQNRRRREGRRREDISLYHRFQNLSDKTHIGLFETDREQRVVYGNAAFFRILGTNDAVMGQLWTEVLGVPPVDPVTWNNFQAGAPLTLQWEPEIGTIPKALRVTMAPIGTDTHGAIGTLEDVSSDRWLIKKLMALKDT